MKLIGDFDNGCPTINLQVESPAAASLSDIYSGIVDTGFDGFVLMPTDVFSQLGLVLDASGSVVTADGTTRDVLTARCTIYLDNQPVVGTALATPAAPEILFGNDLLEKANLTLTVNPKKGTCVLSDE